MKHRMPESEKESAMPTAYAVAVSATVIMVLLITYIVDGVII